MPIDRRAAWALATVLSLVILMAPALWNGFPLLQYDTGGYLAPWFEGTLEINRSVPYGLLLVAGQAALQNLPPMSVAGPDDEAHSGR